MHAHERRRYDRLVADRATINQAAATIRHTAVQATYAGLDRPEVAFAVAGLLDELSRRADSLDDYLRANILRACEAVLRYAAATREAP